MTLSEKYVSELCKQSFLPFWSFPNPIGKKDKELCDVLVVCGNHVIIISIKDISISNHKNELVQYDRWVNKAVYDSVGQIYGAERYLGTVSEVVLADRKTKIKLPPPEARIIYRIAIAFGSKPDFPLPMGDFDKGFVSVFDEQSTFIVLNELDTITDFTNYLRAKEKFIEKKIILIPSEVDFLAIYLQTELKFDNQVNTFVCDTGLWRAYSKSKEYSRWRDEIRDSFIWDRMIETLHRHHVTEQTSEQTILQLEEAVRYINLEPRINRIELGYVLNHSIKIKVKARMLRPLKGANHTYVFIPVTHKNWEGKENELKLRCIVARAENPQVQNIIGISIGRNAKGELWFDICFLHIPEIDKNFITQSREIKEKLGYFKKPVFSHSKDFRR